MAAAGYGNYLSSVGCTYGLGTVYFHSISQMVSFVCRFSSESRTGLAALAPSILPVISKCDCAYLPGLPLHDPRRCRMYRNRTYPLSYLETCAEAPCDIRYVVDISLLSENLRPSQVAGSSSLFNYNFNN